VKYKIEILDKKYPSLRVQQIFDEFWVNTFDDLTDEDVIQQMHDWCHENDCGYRTSYDTFKFRNKDQMMMFILRWA